MTKRQFVVLAFRLLAVYLVFNFITSISSLYSMFGYSPVPGSVGLVAGLAAAGLIMVGYAFIIWFFWVKSEWLMQRIMAVPSLADKPELPSDEKMDETSIVHDDYDERLTSGIITQVAFSVVGLLTALGVLPRLVRAIETLSNPYRPGDSLSNSLLYILPELLTFALGLWLFLRPWQWQQWILKMKLQSQSSSESSGEE